MSNVPDRLDAMFNRQRAFAERIAERNAEPLAEDVWNFIGNCNNCNAEGLCESHASVVEQYVIRFADALLMEAAELKDWCRWKHWSNQPGNKSGIRVGSIKWLEECRAEVADITCFLINIARWLWMWPSAFDQAHERKMAINHKRQDSGDY